MIFLFRLLSSKLDNIRDRKRVYRVPGKMVVNKHFTKNGKNTVDEGRRKEFLGL